MEARRQAARTDQETAAEGLERVHRTADAMHVVYPAGVMDVHDTWEPDLVASDTGGEWWNRYRVYRFGPLRFTVEMDVSREHRLPRDEVLAVAEAITDRVELPPIHVCGSHSPLSPRLPTSISDLDLVTFIPFESFFDDVQGWCATEAAVKAVVAELAAAREREISCGFLLEDFQRFPFMHEAVGVAEDDKPYWDYDDAAVVRVLDERMAAFRADVAGPQSYRRVIDAITDHLGDRVVTQVVTQARWEDVGWSLTRPAWTAMMRAFFVNSAG